VTVAAKEFRYTIELDRAGRVTADGGSPLGVESEADVAARRELLRKIGYKL